MRPTRAYIDLNKLDKNIRALKRLITANQCNAEYMAVVKANAYGHGAVEVSKQAIKSGAKWLAVAMPEEGAQLREAGIKAPILVLGAIDESAAKLIVEYDLTQTVFSEDIVKLLNELGKKYDKRVPVHIKLDTGMGRIGIRDAKELVHFIEIIKNLPYIDHQGIFTHFATADEKDKNFTQEQFNKFMDMLAMCKAHDIDFRYIHAANSAASIEYPNTYFDIVREGIAMYGYYPSTQIDTEKVVISPILEWHSKIVHIKEVETGCSIGYGRTFITDKNMKIATIPVGYADGYNRLLSNTGHVLVRGQKAPILGRICMDQTMIDISHIPGVTKGDDVILIGSQGQNTITADDIAKLCHTISYEILTSISSRVERLYIK